jgi:hypothetical protein
VDYWSPRISSTQYSVFRHWHGLLYIFIIYTWWVYLQFLNNVIFIKTKVLLHPSGIGDISRFWLFCLDPLVFVLSKLFNCLSSQSFDLERTLKVVPLKSTMEYDWNQKTTTNVINSLFPFINSTMWAAPAYGVFIS